MTALSPCFVETAPTVQFSACSSGVSPTSPLYFGAAEGTHIKLAGRHQAGQCDMKQEHENTDVVVLSVVCCGGVCVCVGRGVQALCCPSRVSMRDALVFLLLNRCFSRGQQSALVGAGSRCIMRCFFSFSNRLASCSEHLAGPAPGLPQPRPVLRLHGCAPVSRWLSRSHGSRTVTVADA